MKALSLVGLSQPENIIAWYQGTAISCGTFLAHVADCMETLPDTGHVLNLCVDRYHFLVGFAAALLRQQITLLPPSRASKVIEHIGRTYSKCYLLTDGDEKVAGLDSVSLNLVRSPNARLMANPAIPPDRIAVIAFTSGTTGTPRPNPKTWISLVTVAQKTGRRIVGEKDKIMNLVATVPQQHMYGLETSIMLPLHFGWSFHSGRPFYPEDIRSALAAVPEKRILVSTPIHLRACLAEQTRFPGLNAILSATAPLSKSLAQGIETHFQTQVIEIYGFAEAGTIATRRTVTGENWKLLDGLSLTGNSNRHSVKTPYFEHPITIPDAIASHGPWEFDLQGRPGNLINIGGHRASIDDLNYQLTDIEGVIDGVFYMPESREDTVTRLIAFAVAPGKTPEELLSTLRKKIDPVFLPRPLYLVDSLPRNPTGKLPRKALEALAADQEGRQERKKSRIN